MRAKELYEIFQPIIENSNNRDAFSRALLKLDETEDRLFIKKQAQEIIKKKMSELQIELNFKNYLLDNQELDEGDKLIIKNIDKKIEKLKNEISFWNNYYKEADKL